MQGADLSALVGDITHTSTLLYPENGVKNVVTALFEHGWVGNDELNFWKLIPRDECLQIESGH